MNSVFATRPLQSENATMPTLYGENITVGTNMTFVPGGLGAPCPPLLKNIMGMAPLEVHVGCLLCPMLCLPSHPPGHLSITSLPP